MKKNEKNYMSPSVKVHKMELNLMQNTSTPKGQMSGGSDEAKGSFLNFIDSQNIDEE